MLRNMMLMNSVTLRFVPLDLDKRRIGPMSYKWIRRSGRVRGQNSHTAISIKWNLLRVCLPDGEPWNGSGVDWFSLRIRRSEDSEAYINTNVVSACTYPLLSSPYTYISTLRAFSVKQMHYVSRQHSIHLYTCVCMCVCVCVCARARARVCIYRAPFSHYLIM